MRKLLFAIVYVLTLVLSAGCCNNTNKRTSLEKASLRGNVRSVLSCMEFQMPESGRGTDVKLFHLTLFKYDNKGNLLSDADYLVRDIPVMEPAGFEYISNVERYTFEEDGFVCLEVYLGESEVMKGLVLYGRDSVSGEVKTEVFYPEDALIKKTDYIYGCKERLKKEIGTDNAGNISEWIYEYSFGRLTRSVMRDDDLDERIIIEFDSYGRPVREVREDISGEPVAGYVISHNYSGNGSDYEVETVSVFEADTISVYREIFSDGKVVNRQLLYSDPDEVGDETENMLITYSYNEKGHMSEIYSEGHPEHTTMNYTFDDNDNWTTMHALVSSGGSSVVRRSIRYYE